jgi:hypothetical protein
MKFSVKVNWQVKEHSGWFEKDVEDENQSIEAFFDGIKPSIKRGIPVPVHRNIVDSLVLFEQPKKGDMKPLTMSETFKEAFKEAFEEAAKEAAKETTKKPKKLKLELYTGFYNPNGSDRAAKRKRED